MPEEFTRNPGGTDPFGQRPASGTPASTQDLKDKVAADVSAVRSAVHDGRVSAEEKVRDTLTGQKNTAALQVGGIASALEKVGSELEATDQAGVGRYTRELGRSVHGFADQLEGKDLGEIANMAEEFGRKQPLAFLGLAAVAGLAASRFLTSSAKRDRTVSTNTAPAVQPSAGSMGAGGADYG